jgi:hypothetical protein
VNRAIRKQSREGKLEKKSENENKRRERPEETSESLKNIGRKGKIWKIESSKRLEFQN